MSTITIIRQVFPSLLFGSPEYILQVLPNCAGIIQSLLRHERVGLRRFLGVLVVFPPLFVCPVWVWPVSASCWLAGSQLAGWEPVWKVGSAAFKSGPLFLGCVALRSRWSHTTLVLLIRAIILGVFIQMLCCFMHIDTLSTNFSYRYSHFQYLLSHLNSHNIL